MRTARGYEQNGFTRTELKVYGMKDAVAAQAAYDALGALEGIQQVYLDIAHRRISVAHRSHPGMVKEMIQTLRQLGFRALQKN